MRAPYTTKLCCVVTAVALIIGAAHAGDAGCSAPQVDTKVAHAMNDAIRFSLPQGTALTPTSIRLSVVAREPEGRQLARAEAILPADSTVWRPALVGAELSAARRVKLLFELQTECASVRSALARHHARLRIALTIPFS